MVDALVAVLFVIVLVGSCGVSYVLGKNNNVTDSSKQLELLKQKHVSGLRKMSLLTDIAAATSRGPKDMRDKVKRLLETEIKKHE